MTSPTIIHIDTGKTFRGGQRQLHLLSSRLHIMGFRQAVAIPGGSGLAERIKDIPILQLSPTAMIRTIRLSRLKEMIVKQKANIVHAHDSHAHTLGILLKRWNPELKLVVTRRVIFPPSGTASRKFKYGRAVDRFIAISKAVKSSLTDAGIDGGLIEVIPSGLEINAIRESVPDGVLVSSMLPGYLCIIASAGALTHEKDMTTAIQAFALASEQISDLGMVIFGDGPERSRLERLKAKLGMHQLVFAGHREPMAPLLKACRLFLLTSISEGLNTSAIEAAACGLPLVVSDVGGLPEIAEHQYNGLVCPPGKAERFAEAIVEVIRDDSLHRRLAAGSVERAARFDIEATAKKTVDVYKRVLAG